MLEEDAAVQGEPSQPPPGLLQSLRGLIANLVALAHTRLELITTEIEEEIQGAVSLLVWTLVALMFAGLGVVMIAILILAVFWDDHRIMAASLLTGAFLLAAAVAAMVAVARVKGRSPFLSASIEELKRDRESLERTA
jgi:uncharacterized membrane protein YqjE